MGTTTGVRTYASRPSSGAFASLMLSVVLPLPSLPYVGPALVKDQRGRPDQPLPPLEEAEIAGCVAKLRGGSWPVLLS